MNKMLRIAFLALLLMATAGATELDKLVEAGNKQWSEGNLDQAEATFREAISLDPGAALPHARLAGLLLSQNRNGAVRTEYQNAIMNDPEDPNLFLALAIVYLHEKSYSSARAMVDMALELEPDRENALKLKQYVTSRMVRPGTTAGEDIDAPLAIPPDMIHGSSPARVMQLPH